MLVIGINAFHADSSAAIYKDGKLLAAVEEERFARIKHFSGFPLQSILYCLEAANAKWEDIDICASAGDAWAKMPQRLLFQALHLGNSLKTLAEKFKNKSGSALYHQLELASNIPARYFEKKSVRVEHHLAHCASAYYPSGFERAACLSIDGSGDFTTTKTGVFSDGKFEKLQSLNFPHSLGLFYTAFTQLLDFINYGDEYKVMGLAAYGKPRYVDSLSNVIQILPEGRFRLNEKYFNFASGNLVSVHNGKPVVATIPSLLMLSEFGNRDFQNSELTEYHVDLAASVQQKTEQVVMHVLQHLDKNLQTKNLCLAGGVAQNSVLIGKISEQTNFKNIYVPPASGDAGLACGAAMLALAQRGSFANFNSQSAYSGPRFLNEDIVSALQNSNLNYFEADDEAVKTKVVECIVKGEVVGWFQGQMEFGPRALGNRSILADPRRNDIRDLLNTKIKFREKFRPFAPSVLQEKTSEYFEILGESPFMEKVVVVRQEKQNIIPAVTHVDGTARVQTVSRQQNEKFYNLIEAFYSATNVPMLVNTSFNENEPIVNTPKEALDCFQRTGMDMLVLGNYLVQKA